MPVTRPNHARYHLHYVHSILLPSYVVVDHVSSSYRACQITSLQLVRQTQAACFKLSPGVCSPFGVFWSLARLRVSVRLLPLI